jgi:mono/diheme cytochrome c family protein
MRRYLHAWQPVALCIAAAATGNASAAQDDLIAQGRAAFTHRCAMCHREGQTGTFILARRLGKEKSLLEQRTDLQPDYIRQVVRAGLVNMPRLSRVEMPDPDLDGVIAYLVSPRKSNQGAP